MTPQEADERSAARAARNQRRLFILAAFVLGTFLVLAGLLQREQSQLRSEQNQLHGLLVDMCQQRRTNALRSVAFYDGMIQIEQHNKFIDNTLREQRIRLFEAAKPQVPVCPQ